MSSAVVYGFAAFGYVGALFGYIGNLALDRDRWRRVATVLASLGFILQTVGLALRWYEAGLHEVQAKEVAEGITLSGLAYFVTMTSHPPWSNLYEIMVFMSWGIVVVFLVADVRWRLKGAGIFAIGVALLAFGIASLTLDARVTPLVPALRSYWLHLHVFSASIGYAAGLLAATASLLYLAASGTHPHKVAFGAQLTQLVLLVLLGRGTTLLVELGYKAKLLTGTGDQVYAPAANGEFAPFYAIMPGVGWLLMAAIVAAIVALVLHRRAWMTQSEVAHKQARLSSVLSVGLLGLTMLLILAQDLAGSAPVLDSRLSAMLRPAGTYRFALGSNQWDLGLFALALVGGLFSLWMLFAPDTLRRRLPQSAVLDLMAYRAIMMAFTFVGILIVTGAIWAHYAWGRYWGWDPKETGSLVIWFVYAAYLHTRITHGLSGRPSAAIAIFGFFVVLAGFLGVNLGWFSGGLHAYGSG
ncbi:MAG: cytochrome c biogenesis protein CcsA [Pseudomonadota bacterium]